MDDLLSEKHYNEKDYIEKSYYQLNRMIKQIGFKGLHCREPINNTTIQDKISVYARKNNIQPIPFNEVIKRFSNKLKRNLTMTISRNAKDSNIVWDSKTIYYTDTKPNIKRKTTYKIRPCINHSDKCIDQEICETYHIIEPEHPEQPEPEQSLEQQDEDSEERKDREQQRKQKEIDTDFLPDYLQKQIQEDKIKQEKKKRQYQIAQRQKETNCTPCPYCSEFLQDDIYLLFSYG